MRLSLFTFLFLVVVTLITSWKITGDSAFAVVESPKSAYPSSVVEKVQASVVRVDVPVFWRLTKTNFLRKGVAARTESFRETWSIEMRTGQTFLISPRAEVQVYKSNGKENATDSSLSTLPDSILVLENDFAKLIGATNNWAENKEVSEQKGNLITLVITKPPKGGVELTLNLSEEDRFAVHFTVGTPVSM